MTDALPAAPTLLSTLSLTRFVGRPEGRISSVHPKRRLTVAGRPGLSYRRGIAKRALATAFWLGLALSAPPAWAAPLRVRGSAVIQAHATPVDGGLEIRGQLQDESSRPFGDAPVRLWLLPARGKPPENIVLPSGCGPTSPHSVRPAPGGARYIVVRANDAGRFCVRLRGQAISGTVRLRFAGNDYFAATETDLDVDSTRRALGLLFSPEPRVLSLERRRHLIGVATSIEPSDISGQAEGAPSIRLSLELQPKDGHRRELASATLRAGDRALFAVDSSALGGVGPARLTVAFAGSPTLEPARLTTVVERTAWVTLSLQHPVARSNPHRGAGIVVRATSRAGAVPGGTVEARFGGESVGSAPVVNGIAHVVAIFDAPREKNAMLTLRYLPSAPWWLPGAPIDVAVPLAPPSPWRRLPWVLAAIGIALWVVRGWHRPARRETPGHVDPTEPPGRPALALVEPGPARSGWRGSVRDAHDGSPIADARVLLRVPSFGPGGVAAETTTDEDGQFSLPHLDGARVEGATLEASARWHSTLVEPLVAPGHVAIALVSRRRALLDLLVGWARRRGPPWAGRNDPTPGHVVEVARDRSVPDVADWAQGVQQAAFGPTPPDETRELELRERAPHGSSERTEPTE